MDSSFPSSPWINRTLGDRQRYRIVNRLGGGGMGDVFLAIDTLLGQEVALKLLKEKLLAEGDLRRRFEREVLLCAALRSDHVVQVKDYGVTPEGNPFYIMEYLRGQTLGQLLRQERQVTVNRTIEIVIQVCAGLHSAHTGVFMWREGTDSNERTQVVHRDLKPENIFLVSTTLGELVKVLDFGIAKISGNQHQGDSTHTGVFMGTFQYAAPEQLEGCKDVDERADIYSLGMILYEMLTGTDPFNYQKAKNSGGGMYWVRAHTSVEPKSLREQPNCEHIPIELEAVVLKCLQKDPCYRFASADELYQALRAIKDTNSANSSQTMWKSEETTFTSPAQPKTNATTFLPSQMQQKLEANLANYVGPIANILLKQALAQSNSYEGLIARLLKHLPAHQRAEFEAKTKDLAKSTTPQPQSSTFIPLPAPPATTMISLSESNAPISLEPSFIKRCEQELAEIIGPIAHLIVQRAIAQKTSQEKFVDILTKQIPNSTQAQAFRKRLQS